MRSAYIWFDHDNGEWVGTVCHDDGDEDIFLHISEKFNTPRGPSSKTLYDEFHRQFPTYREDPWNLPVTIEWD